MIWGGQVARGNYNYKTLQKTAEHLKALDFHSLDD